MNVTDFAWVDLMLSEWEGFYPNGFMAKHKKSILDQNEIKICCVCVSAMYDSTHSFLFAVRLLICEPGVNTTC